MAASNRMAVLKNARLRLSRALIRCWMSEPLVFTILEKLSAAPLMMEPEMRSRAAGPR